MLGSNPFVRTLQALETFHPKCEEVTFVACGNSSVHDGKEFLHRTFFQGFHMKHCDVYETV